MAVRFLIFIIFSTFGFSSSVVEVMQVKKGSLKNEGIFVGAVSFEETSYIASQRDGLVEKVYFNVGDKILLNQKLVLLNKDLLPQKIKIQEAKIKEATYKAQKLESELNRYKNLLDSQSVALQQYENLDFDLKANLAGIESLKANIEILKQDLQKTSILAPFSGVVIEKKTNVGQWLKTGDPIALVGNTKNVNVIVHVQSSIAKFLKLNQKVKLSIDNKPYIGRIKALIPKADSLSKNFPVYIKIKSNPNLFEGMQALVTLDITKKVSGYIIPRDSILTRNNKTIIFVARKQEGELIAKALEVKLLQVKAQSSVINARFNKGDKVIIKGQANLIDGSKIEIFKD